MCYGDVVRSAPSRLITVSFSGVRFISEAIPIAFPPSVFYSFSFLSVVLPISLSLSLSSHSQPREMKASDEAFGTASAFLGQDVVGNADKLQARRALDAFSIPQSDEGLCILAANGDWASVVALADKLEDEAAAKSHSAASAAESMRVPSQTAALIARLPYVLVQVTAFFKMQRVGAAKKLLDTLGDLEGEDYLYRDTKENFAPFSLRFLAALMPFYLGAPMESQHKLYRILDECVRKRTSSVRPESFLWLHREGRVRRALAYLHYVVGQYDVSIQHFHRLIAATDETNGVSSAEVVSLGTPLRSWQRVQRVFLLQQLACLCLHCGALALSQGVFKQIEEMSDAASCVGGEAEAIAHVKRMNEAFLLAFYGRFDEAAAEFREIAASTKRSTKASADQRRTGGNGDQRDTTLFEETISQIQANAEVSEAACRPYCREAGCDPHTAIASLITAAEAQLKDNPKLLASSDAFVAALVRLYTLAGDRKPKLEQLASVLEVFRCDAASLPHLEKLV